MADRDSGNLIADIVIALDKVNALHMDTLDAVCDAFRDYRPDFGGDAVFRDGFLVAIGRLFGHPHPGSGMHGSSMGGWYLDVFMGMFEARYGWYVPPSDDQRLAKARQERTRAETLAAALGGHVVWNTPIMP